MQREPWAEKKQLKKQPEDEEYTPGSAFCLLPYVWLQGLDRARKKAWEGW